jgi:hypothetical protein
MQDLEDAEDQVLLIMERTAAVVDALARVDGSGEAELVAHISALSRAIQTARALMDGALRSSPPPLEAAQRQDSYHSAARLDLVRPVSPHPAHTAPTAHSGGAWRRRFCPSPLSRAHGLTPHPSCAPGCREGQLREQGVG